MDLADQVAIAEDHPNGFHPIAMDLEPQDKTRSAPVVQQAGSMTLAENSPAALTLKALQMGLDLSKVEKMMELQERWEKREAEKACADSFANFRGENIIIPKTKHVDRGRGGSFSQAEFDGVCSRLSPALSRHGFGFRHSVRFGLKPFPTEENPNAGVPWVWVTCILTHRQGHTMVDELEAPQDDQSSNSPAQNMQSTASFLKRQTLLNVTGTATGGEDDEAKFARQQKSEAKAGHDDDLRDAGRAAAMEGLAKLTEWWKTLSAKDQAAMSKDFGEMRKAARRADEEGK